MKGVLGKYAGGTSGSIGLAKEEVSHLLEQSLVYLFVPLQRKPLNRMKEQT